ncbi:SAM-dependent methyltransferase [Candidatus Parcubacteria bacterium]|nr:MAG: SAM-dependent methyltransferase [Candidatus Parcubacteria bacterium]
MRELPSKDNQLSLDATLERAVEALKFHYPSLRGDHLDLGAGTGALIHRLRRDFNIKSRACDYTDRFMRLDDVAVDVVDLNMGVLPYEDQAFDLVTFTEVAEHLENYRAIIREIYRVLKPGGVILITTPNILNLKSRMRFLVTGFWSMFGPLHVGETAIESTGGHITPISYPYLAHALMDAGFSMPYVTMDKPQFPSLMGLVLLGVPIRIFAALSWRKERNKYGTIDEHNYPIIETINRYEMLVGRSIVVVAEK